MSNIPSSSRVLTVIGLVFQALTFIFATIIFIIIARLPNFFRMVIEEALQSADEVNMFYQALPFIRGVIVTVLIFQLAFLIANLVLFIPLLQGKKSDAKASTIFLYQAIYGGVSLFGNQLVGIVFLISGIIGRNKMETLSEPVRDGI